MEKLQLTTISLAQDLEVSFATANDITLHPTRIASLETLGGSPLNKQLTSARRLDLAIQFENARMRAIGLQETKSRCPRGRDVLGYMTCLHHYQQTEAKVASRF